MIRGKRRGSTSWLYIGIIWGMTLVLFSFFGGVGYKSLAMRLGVVQERCLVVFGKRKQCHKSIPHHSISPIPPCSATGFGRFLTCVKEPVNLLFSASGPCFTLYSTQTRHSPHHYITANVFHDNSPLIQEISHSACISFTLPFSFPSLSFFLFK